MALAILQTPASASLAQSPIVFSVSSSTDTTNTGFQYVADLYYWDGAVSNSGSSDYTLVKYPNVSGVGIFDLSRILNSTLTDLAQTNGSNVKFFKCDFYTQWQVGVAYVTGSHLTSSVYKALDGYGIFQEAIGVPTQNTTPHWPIMTSGPNQQYFFDGNKGQGSVYIGDLGTPIPTKIVYSGSTGNGQYVLDTTTNTTSTQIDQFPMFPAQSGFPLSSTNLTNYSVQSYAGNTALGTPIQFIYACQQKYPNIRIKWKNRYGQFDWFNFYMVSQNSFSTDRRLYQPQIGSFQSSTLSYNSYDSQNLTYVTNATQQLFVNTFWIEETYNDIIKELLVSDEAYWVYDEAAGDLRPITINTNSIVFKTGVVDKTIQYSFNFDWGQQYKLII